MVDLLANEFADLIAGNADKASAMVKQTPETSARR